MSEIAEQQHKPLAVPTEAGNIMAVIARAAADPAVDIDKMERLLLMQERVVERQAKADFIAAMSVMQPALPSIAERGAADKFTFARWEDIQAAIKPVMADHGFALTFSTDFDDGIRVIGILSHKSGHSERAVFRAPPDKSGSKNDIQAIGSTISYGKRHCANALLNLTSHGEDDDGFLGKHNRSMTPEIESKFIQAAQLGDAGLNAAWRVASVAERKAITAADMVRYRQIAAAADKSNKEAAK